jgi:hypothetical protein
MIYFVAYCNCSYGVVRELDRAIEFCQKNELVAGNCGKNISYIKKYQNAWSQNAEIKTVFAAYLEQSLTMLCALVKGDNVLQEMTYKMPAHYQSSMFSAERYIWINFFECVCGKYPSVVSQEIIVYIYLTAAAIIDELTDAAELVTVKNRNTDFVFTYDEKLSE